jgi:long-subunit acyl-CoA synthetase (AMP-forming)
MFSNDVYIGYLPLAHVLELSAGIDYGQIYKLHL